MSSNSLKQTQSQHQPSLLHRCVQVFDDAFDAGFCQQMLSSFHALSRFHTQNGRGIRAGHQDSLWTELDITALTDAGFRRVLLANMYQHLARYNQALGQPIAIPPTEKLSELVIKRYQPGGEEAFQLHFDALGSVANRYLVFLWYLNDVEAGGETAFPALNLEIQPKAGRLLMFPPYWMFQHEGRPPLSGDKYIFSTYFLF
jgi:prolyl 4-hydroxylase